ncbi:hypothetical protein WN51_10514 [Melipona quadrifasciata]|uniref:DUF4219 domain-containing protein n=1 Tax=Melipona quadrifasciata TaxID=166423 RepID=A0A0N0BBE0_9HYME|nr:hypothetical protein WN51_10514 [Melipona quadrifasciata]
MADAWNIANVESLDDSNYFMWKEKIEGILRSKRLWNKVICVKALEKPIEGVANYEEKLNNWGE